MNKLNVKGTTKCSTEYTGIVTLSQYIRGKKVTIAKKHNVGGVPLFNFLADCLTGHFDTAKLDRPTKILLLSVEGETPEEYAIEAKTDFITYSTDPERVYSDTEGVVRYSFIVPQTLFAGTNFNAIGLYPHSAVLSEANDYAALCVIDTSKMTMSASSVLVLDWELHISNKTQ